MNNTPEENNLHEHDNDFLNNNTNRFINNSNNDMDELNSIIKPTQNKFINDDINSQSNSLTELNIENGEGPRIDYTKDPKVQENLEQLEQNGPKKNTITITSEGKVFLLIIVLLLLFIFVLPTIFDYIRDIQYK